MLTTRKSRRDRPSGPGCSPRLPVADDRVFLVITPLHYRTPWVILQGRRSGPRHRSLPYGIPWDVAVPPLDAPRQRRESDGANGPPPCSLPALDGSSCSLAALQPSVAPLSLSRSSCCSANNRPRLFVLAPPIMLLIALLAAGDYPDVTFNASYGTLSACDTCSFRSRNVSSDAANLSY